MIGCGLDLFLIRGLILQICVLSHSEPRHTIANQKPNYKDFGIYRKIKKESCLCVVAKMTFKGQETARKQHRDMTLILPFYRSYDKFRQNLYNLALSGLLSVWTPCGYFSQYILWIDFENTVSTLGRSNAALLLLFSELVLILKWEWLRLKGYTTCKKLTAALCWIKYHIFWPNDQQKLKCNIYVVHTVNL